MIKTMNYRYSFSLLAIVSILFTSFQTAFAFNFLDETRKFELPEKPLFSRLEGEPLIRVGLATNAASVSIATTDSSLVAISPDEPRKFLETTKVTVTARAYRPPEIDVYKFEIPNIATPAEAEALAKELKEAIGEAATFAPDTKTNSWRVSFGETKDTIEEADDYKAFLSDKGFEEIQIVKTKIKQPSSDAVALSRQLKSGAKSEVRSIIKPRNAPPTQANAAKSNPNLVRTISSSQPKSDTVNQPLDPNLREVIVSGTSANARFTSLKSVAFGSAAERVVPVRVNGKAYRGRIEVFVNSRGNLTVVNAVSLEDYLLGVVPNELSLPAIEAQKAQAIAARTYAVANINQFGSKGFDILPTVRSQVYEGFSSETKMGTQAVSETRGMIATYRGKPIMAYYTSTCGGRTENSENVFDHGEPYLRGVECSLEGRRHFDPFLVKTVRVPAKLRDEQNLELTRLMSLLAVNGFQLSTNQLTDDFFEDVPTPGELSNWLNQLAAKLGKTFPNVNKDTAKPLELARILAQMIYGDAYADTLLSEADINYQLSFDDAAEIPKDRRADAAVLLRDGFLTIYPDLTLKPNKPFSRAKMLRVVEQIYKQKKFMPALQTGTTQAAENGKLVIKTGKTNRQLNVRPDVFLFRQFGGALYQVREIALVGSETVNFQTDASGSVIYLEVEPATATATAEKMSPFTLWNVNLTPSVVQSRLSRYVRGIGTLIDVRINRKGFSRRATDLEIVGTNGTFHLLGGKIRSALKLNEQLFVLNKRYDQSGRAISYSFTGRGWGHGVGMCQYGAYGLAKMGVKYDAIVKHYYTGVDLTKAY
ncbi:MAG TPA: SpoIID/LytB domain-containing protein [Pyrinomonadaceae bacterium]|nr:SpoIID/LytB domain-containing protein [Pyrinomonadaceae bacterium]